MAIGDQTVLQIAKIVAPATNEKIEYTPDDGEKLLIFKFTGKGNESSLADVRLYWDLGGADEELLWALDELPMPDSVFHEVTGDGTKKVTVCLSNGCVNSYAMAGQIIMEEIP